MKQWYSEREPRERLALMLASIFLLIFFLYQIVWLPMEHRNQQLHNLLTQQQDTLRLLQQANAQLNPGNHQAQNNHASSKRSSLLSTVDRTAKLSGVRTVIRRIQPQGNGQVQLWIEQASFDQLLRWLGDLQLKHGVYVESASIEKQAQGLVNARFNLIQ